MRASAFTFDLTSLLREGQPFPGVRLRSSSDVLLVSTFSVYRPSRLTLSRPCSVLLTNPLGPASEASRVG